MTISRSIHALAVAGAMLVAGWDAGAAPLTFQTTLGPEVAGATGSGSATLIIDTTANTLSLSVTWGGLSGTTTVAHIHCCTAVPGIGTAGIAVAPGTLPGFPVGVQSGTYAANFNTEDPAIYNPPFVASFGGGTVSGAEAALLAGLFAGTAYLNIHTVVFPGGEIRGFFAAVPEPASLALFGAGLLALGWARRKQPASG